MLTSHTEYAQNNASEKCVFNSYNCHLNIIGSANKHQTFKMEIKCTKIFEILSGKRSPAGETKPRSKPRQPAANNVQLER